MTRANLHTLGYHATKKTGVGRKRTFRCVWVCVGGGGGGKSFGRVSNPEQCFDRKIYCGLRYLENFKDFYEHVIKDKRRKILILALASRVTINNHNNFKTAFNKIVIFTANMLLSNIMAQLCLATSYCGNI